MNCPVIFTERLILRPHRSSDLAECASMWSDPKVYKHIGGKPFSEQESWFKILRYQGLWNLTGYGYWAIEEKSTGHFIGELGFADFKRGIEPSLDDIPEVGWILSSHVHGNGFATEAIRAIIAWADSHLKSPRTVCIINPENKISIQLAQKIGYHQLTQTLYLGAPIILFERFSK